MLLTIYWKKLYTLPFQIRWRNCNVSGLSFSSISAAVPVFSTGQNLGNVDSFALKSNKAIKIKIILLWVNFSLKITKDLWLWVIQYNNLKILFYRLLKMFGRSEKSILLAHLSRQIFLWAVLVCLVIIFHKVFLD